jgi:cation diffusion facilitator family transporter
MELVSANITLRKRKVAFYSFLVALGLTLFKGIVGFATGSLGILAEALHSGMDVVAALVTYFAIRIADKPADETHNFGHGKVENLSALFETGILMITCFWIVYEAYHRLITGSVHIDVTFWSFFVIILAIIVDINRSKILYRSAKKFYSQALEADALHFSSDILSSIVVLFGLVLASFDFYLADSIAAIFVSAIVFILSIRLAKRAIDQLIDRAPNRAKQVIQEIINRIPEVIEVHDIQIRSSGSNIFVNLNIHLDSKLTVEEAHSISHKVETEIQDSFKNSIVHIHQEPSTEH